MSDNSGIFTVDNWLKTDPSVPVCAELPLGYQHYASMLGYEGASTGGADAQAMHFCPVCEGWIDGDVDMYARVARIDNDGALLIPASIRVSLAYTGGCITVGPKHGNGNGMSYHCHRCGHELAFGEFAPDIPELDK